MSAQSTLRVFLSLWVGCCQERHIVPPPPPQRWASVLLAVAQRLWQRFPLALGKQQYGQHGQQGQRGIDYMVEEVAVVVPQVHERRAEASYAAQGEDGAHTTASAQTRKSEQTFNKGFYKIVLPLKNTLNS